MPRAARRADAAALFESMGDSPVARQNDAPRRSSQVLPVSR
jgi:hypothetical protein